MLVRVLLVVAALIGAYFLFRWLRRFSWGGQVHAWRLLLA